jgi:hypothetical protein
MRFHLLWLIVILGMSGCAAKYEHNPNLAAQKAEEFATLAFVKRDFDAAYGLLAESTQSHVPLAQFKQTLIKNQTEARPVKIVAKEYEPMPGEKAIYVFLTGENGSEQFSFRITMEGTAESGYKVLRFDPGRFNLPGGERKKLPA